MGKLRKVNFEDLIPGKKYFTKCGIWEAATIFVGAFKVGKRIKYRFTYGPADNWENQFCHFETKSGIKVYEC